MPAPTNRQPGQTISSADINAIATVANAAEATAVAARDLAAAALPEWNTVATKTAAYTAATGQAVPVDTTGAAFTLTLPTAAINSRVRVVNVATTGTNALTVASGSTILGSPVTIAPGGSIDFFCPVAGVWAKF